MSIKYHDGSGWRDAYPRPPLRRPVAGGNTGQNVDLTGYAKETWVQEGFQPKGDYLTEVPVTSVNGKAGAVALTAADVGALPSTYTPPDQTAAQVGADPKGTAAVAVSGHNASTDAHGDIRLLIDGLTTRLNALANSTDTDLDQMAELVAYIKSNKSLIDGITTSKVSISDIVDNLTTNVANKPLSAAQGVVLKALIDAAPIAKADSAALGAEMATASGWTLGAGWSGSFANGFTHASGNTEPLTFTPSGIAAGKLYQVTFKSSVAMTTTNLFVQVGNSTEFNLYGAEDGGYLSIGVLAADASGLVFTPESSFTGKLTEISLKEITGPYEAVRQYLDTSGAASFEIHVTPRGLENVFLGPAAGQNNTSGQDNVAVGVNALMQNTSGFWNSALGKDALKNNIGGSRNIAVGYNAMRDNEVGQRNIAIGTFAMTQMRKGNWNIAIGADSMNEATGGDKNTAIGFNTLVNSQGDNNVALGADVLAHNTTGKNNTGIGTMALAANVNASENVAIGKSALQKVTSGSWNTAIGNTALYNVTTGQKNVAIGMSAGKSLTTGRRCIAIGAEADLEAAVDDQLNIGNLLKGSVKSGAAYLLLNGGLRLPSIPTAYSGIGTEVWNNGGVLMVGDGGIDTITQAVIAALPVYNGEVE